MLSSVNCFSTKRKEYSVCITLMRISMRFIITLYDDFNACFTSARRLASGSKLCANLRLSADIAKYCGIKRRGRVKNGRRDALSLKKFC